MKIVGYVRVSTATQAEDGLGLEVQKAALRAWCKANGHRLTSILSDEGISGAKELEDRPGLADALDMIRSRKAQGIVVPRLDRLARDLIVQETILAEIRRIGGEVVLNESGRGQLSHRRSRRPEPEAHPAGAWVLYRSMSGRWSPSGCGMGVGARLRWAGTPQVHQLSGSKLGMVN